MTGSIDGDSSPAENRIAFATDGSESVELLPESRNRIILRRFVGVVLAVYWVSLFIATHVPLPDIPLQGRGADKAAHLLGYGVLGLLLTFWTALQRPLTLKVVFSMLLVLGAYGAADELLQIPVGRYCDLGDWISDFIGGTIGVLIMGLICRLRVRE